jgi:lysophospholipase L1-like esterase
MRRAGVLNGDTVVRDVSTLVPRVDERHYRDNLVALVKETRAAGVPIVFVLLRDNPAETEYLNLGVDLLEQGATEEAVSKLKTAVELDNMFSDLARLYLSRAYRAEGRETDARNVLMHAVERSLTGGRPVRLDRDYNRIMTDVASEYDVPVIDGASVLAEHPGDFVDFCHFNASGHRRVAELLAREITQVLSPDSSRSRSSGDAQR